MNTITPHSSLCLAAWLTLIASAPAKPHNPDTDWFRDAGWGVFVHFLWDVQNVGGRENTQGEPPMSWDALVKDFDTEKFAEQIKETGAPYVCFGGWTAVTQTLATTSRAGQPRHANRAKPDRRTTR